MRNLWKLILLLASFNTFSEELALIENTELTFVLNNLISLGETKRFEEQGFEARIYTISSSQACTALYECRPMQTLFVATTEGDEDEGPVMSVYKLPEHHQWKVLKWQQQKDQSQGVFLESIDYLKDGTTKIKNHLLKLTYTKVTLNAL
jgi:hypothetical protein